jgi:hypothetical protein
MFGDRRILKFETRGDVVVCFGRIPSLLVRNFTLLCCSCRELHPFVIATSDVTHDSLNFCTVMNQTKDESSSFKKLQKKEKNKTAEQNKSSHTYLIQKLLSAQTRHSILLHPLY